MQELDSRLDVLRHRVAHPPEADEIAQHQRERAALDGRARDLQVEVEDLAREQRKADDEVETVKARRVRDQQRLDAGTVTSPKDLERLQHELVSLDRRISDLEDAELEVMERLEATQAELADMRVGIEALDARLVALAQARDERVAALGEEIAGLTWDRSSAVERLPADLLALYEKLREQKGGVGAAALRARRCEGCSLELNSSELAQIAKEPADSVVRCDECGRILVRTHESGL